LKPIGNYYLHRDTDLVDMDNVANRIDTVTKAEIEAMTPQERAEYSVADPAGGARAFYQLIFEPVAE
jgi:large repetitive protein